MNTTVFKCHSVPFFLLTSESHRTAEYNKRSNPSIHKQRMKSSLLTPDFQSWEEREVCRRGSTFSALTAGWYKPRLPQYCSFGRMCCVYEINGDMRKTRHNTPPPLTPSQTLRLLWISCLAEVNGDMRGGTAVRSCSQHPSATAAYHTLKCVISPLLSSRPGIYWEVQRKSFSKMMPQFNQDVSHGWLPRKSTR